MGASPGRPTRDLAAGTAFSGGLLGLARDGPFNAALYELVLFALPGGNQLELMATERAGSPST